MGMAKRAEIASKSHDYRAAPDFMDKLAAPTIPAVKEWRFDRTTLEGKVWNITRAGKAVELTIEGLYSPWQPSSLNESARKTLTLRLPAEWDAPFDCMEHALVHEVIEQSDKFFGGASSQGDKVIGSAEDIAESYKFITKKNGEYPRHLRVKIQTAGAYTVRYWNKDKKLVSALEDHTGMRFTAKVVLRSLWFSDEAWGLCAEATDLMMQDEVAACPF